MRGTADRVSTAQEGAETVLRFMLVLDDGKATAVEMRGGRITGLIGDGDRVTLPRAVRPDRDGLLRPVELRNRTTRAVVRAHRRRALSRILGAAIGIVGSTLLGLAATEAFRAVFFSASSTEGIVDDDAGTDSKLVFAAIFAALAILLLWSGVLSGRLSDSVPRWAIAVGAVAGIGLALLLAA